MVTTSRRVIGGVMRGRVIRTVVAALVMIGTATGAGSGAISDAMERTLPSGASTGSDVILDDDPCWPLDAGGNELVHELEALDTRDARQLVSVIRHAAPDDRLTLHLAIAQIETRGRILEISGSGAAGLAQATPIAILAERIEGPLFVTEDYVRGAEAYFLKKPLDDADMIATFLLAGGRRARAATLLGAAWSLRNEGSDELDYLEPWADEAFAGRRANATEENVATLERLGQLIESHASRAELKRFRDRTRARYRALKDVQRQAWRAYRDDLASRRDALLQEVYGVSEKQIEETAAYEAGEILATRLDVRFSPTLMAEFLTRHLDTKLAEAAAMGVEEEDLESTAIGLYNSGSPNMKRMMSGLIVALPETDAYLRKVPGVRDRLDASLSGISQY